MTTMLVSAGVYVQDPPLDVSGLNWTKDFSELTLETC